jgi:Na+-driven multidrug efflux pump
VPLRAFPAGSEPCQRDHGSGELLACFVALGGVFEGSGTAPVLVRITAFGVALQLALAHALSGWGLPGVCLAMALSMAVQCAAAAGMHRRLAPEGW